MPGELFVEYQLAAQQMRPDLFVAMAALWRLRTRLYRYRHIAYSQEAMETGIVSPSGTGSGAGVDRRVQTLLHANPTEERTSLFDVPVIHSSWDDLTDGIQTKADWQQRRTELKPSTWSCCGTSTSRKSLRWI
ncbi:MAG: hypothetical protein R3C56_13220 [Pirellulaceae bacterium]